MYLALNDQLNYKQYRCIYVVPTGITFQEFRKNLLGYFLQGFCIPVNRLQTTAESSTFQ